MKKFLYITDQEEYTEHSFIGPLFEKYLKEYYEVDIVYFSDFKSDTELKENRYIVPSQYQTEIMEELERNNIDVSSYSYVVVRNIGTILKSVLKSKSKYNYKVGYRLSFPKRRAKMQVDQANNKASFLNILQNKIQTFSETNMINQCDLFLPTSQRMHEEFFDDVTAKTFISPLCIDPERLHDNIQHEDDEKRFFYAGTLDKLREFDVVLDAFSKVQNNKWKLMISTKDPEYTQKIIETYPNIKNKIEVHNARSKDELLDLIAKADIGVSLLPDIPLFNTSTPVKILDYYTSGVPCFMTNSANNNRIFTDEYDAWFCNFTRDSIKEKIEYITTLSKEEVAKVGVNGQERLLNIRNYKDLARNLVKTLDSL
jgi:glycosyltransferase involved in cell wall biosynthesis